MSQPRTREEVRSDEEYHFILWLHEACRAGLVDAWQYEPQTFELFPAQHYIEEITAKTKSKQVARHLHQAESYTPDFEVNLSELGKKHLYEVFKPSLLASFAGACGTVWIDVKGAYNPNDQPRYFSSTRKAMFHVHAIWIAKVVPFYKTKGKAKGLFVDTFAPECLRMMKSGKQLNACGRECRSVSDFLALS